MIYITGDCHGDFHRFAGRNAPALQGLTKQDYVIICGDFGGVWEQTETSAERYQLDWLDGKPFTTLFVDGNHENYDRLDAFPVEAWNGGQIHRIRPSVFHLMRGQIFTLEGKRIFTFGGAASHDISGGILNPDAPDYRRRRKFLDRHHASYRVEHLSWWERELPDEAELQEGLDRLAEVDYHVDTIVTHCCASSLQTSLGSDYAPDRLTDYFETLRTKCTYRRWYFGHYHADRNVTDRDILLYRRVILL